MLNIEILQGKIYRGFTLCFQPKYELPFIEVP